MKRRIVILAVLLFVFSKISTAEILEKRSEDGFFIIKMRIEPSNPVVGNNIVTLTIFDSRSKTPIESAKIEAVPWMTTHSHGSSKKTIIKEKGNGVYVVENVYFTMEGDWDLLVNIQINKKEDKVIFTFKDVRK